MNIYDNNTTFEVIKALRISLNKFDAIRQATIPLNWNDYMPCHMAIYDVSKLHSTHQARTYVISQLDTLLN